MAQKIIKMTQFIFEDNNTYYFEIYKRDFSTVYHLLKVYTKKDFRIFNKKLFSYYSCLRSNGNFQKLAKLVDVELKVSDIKRQISEIILISKSIGIKDWDGFVGNVPESTKKALSRDLKINNLLN